MYILSVFLSSFSSCYNNKIHNKIILSRSQYSISVGPRTDGKMQNCMYTQNLTTSHWVSVLPKTDEIDMSAIMNDCRKWFLWDGVAGTPPKTNNFGCEIDARWRMWRVYFAGEGELWRRWGVALLGPRGYEVRIWQGSEGTVRWKTNCCAATHVDPRLTLRCSYLTYSLREISYYIIHGFLRGSIKA